MRRYDIELEKSKWPYFIPSYRAMLDAISQALKIVYAAFAYVAWGSWMDLKMKWPVSVNRLTKSFQHVW